MVTTQIRIANPRSAECSTTTGHVGQQSICGFCGLRTTWSSSILRKLTFAAFALDIEAWFQIFRCMRTTFLLLETVTAERLDNYCEHPIDGGTLRP